MNFEHVAAKISSLREARNFSLLMVGLTGTLSGIGLASGLGTPAVLTGLAALVYTTNASVRQYKINKWENAQNLIDDNASSEEIKQALERAAGPAKKVEFQSTLPNLDVPTPRPVRKEQVNATTEAGQIPSASPSAAPKM